MKKILINGTWELILPDHREKALESWETERLSAMVKNCNKSDVIYDIGAEEGDITALLASRVEGVCIIEPSPKFWPNMKAIWDANKLKTPIKCFAGFASNITELNPANNDVNGAINNGWPLCAYDEISEGVGFRHLSQQADATPQIKLDEFQKGIAMPTMLTIDVEGSELEVLKGAQNILTFAKPLVFVSIHPEFMYEMWSKYSYDLFQYMNNLGYKYHLLAFDHEYHTVFYHTEGKAYNQ